MALMSSLLRSDPALQACAAKDSAHVLPGAVGAHVGKIQSALLVLDGVSVPPDELRSRSYGTATAKAVLQYKTRRRIINFSYQSVADNIVGRMTIAAMDKELLLRERLPLSVREFGNEPSAT